MNQSKLIKITRSALFLSALLMTSFAQAGAPVEDIGGNSNAMPESATTYPVINSVPVNSQASASSSSLPALNLSDSQRLTRLEQQINNVTSMNLPQQISDLQQQVQQLSGQLQEAQHQLKTLSDQQMSFYQDLDQRLNRLNANSTAAVAPSSGGAKVAPMTADAKLKESNEYQAAVNLLMKKNYAKAGSAFKSYLTHYPSGSYTANAHYWLGEVNLMNHDLNQAAVNFQTVINQYPKSDKVTDARLKLAMVHAQQGNVALARTELNKIKSEHPGSTMAQLATIQLQQLGSVAAEPN